MTSRPMQTYYFIGIGGVGMSALARWCVHKGNIVVGYDRTPSETTRQLEEEGIAVIFEDSIEALPMQVLGKEVHVIYTSAIPQHHPQLRYFIEQGNSVKKRALFLAECCAGKTTLAVAGTHGKTTTSLFLTHLLAQTDLAFTSIMGGFFNPSQSNLMYRGDDIMVVEADEYDRSFLHLHPAVAAITYMESDHLDIYKTEHAFKEAFVQFSKQVKQTLVVSEAIALPGITYGFSKKADYKISEIRNHAAGHTFTLTTPSEVYSGIEINQFGKHNIANATCAVAMAEQIGISAAGVLDALATFPGVYRRMNRHVWENRIIIDDYAHHPTEINSVFETVKNCFPKQKNCVVFQPHLFSRTRDFFDDFVSVLARFDEVILTPIYPARELPIPGISSEKLLAALPHKNKKCIEKSELQDALRKSEATLVAVLGAGDIGLEIEKFKIDLKPI